MCGRYTLDKQPKALIDLFELDELPEELHPRFNIAPSQSIAVVGLKPDGVKRGLAKLTWGFVPHWANSPKESFKSINARSETVANSQMFGESFREKRCLIPADGFFEWKKITEKNKQPFHFRMKDRSLFAFAGIWDLWKADKQVVRSAAILTTTPNDLTKEIHDRMPVIIPREHYAAWLSHDTPQNVLKSFLVPFPAAFMEAVAVSKLVNSPKNDTPECLAPA